MPALPVSLIEPLWAQFSALLPDRPDVDPTHPLGCHRRRTPDQVVFVHVLAALIHGSGYERIATPGCSDRTIRRRVHDWANAGLMPQLHALVLAQYDRLIGLDLRHVCVDGCITKAPGGGEMAGKSPVDRGKQGRKRSLLTDAAGIPLHLVAAGANCPDSTLLRQTLTGLPHLGNRPRPLPVLLDRGYLGAPVQAVLAEAGGHRRDTPQRPSSARACRGALGRGAHAQLAQQLWPVAPLPGAEGGRGGVVPVPGCHHHRHPATPARRRPDVPLADALDDPAAAVSLLPVALRGCLI